MISTGTLKPWQCQPDNVVQPPPGATHLLQHQADMYVLQLAEAPGSTGRQQMACQESSLMAEWELPVDSDSS